MAREEVERRRGAREGVEMDDLERVPERTGVLVSKSVPFLNDGSAFASDSRFL
jgi:hypothetical protein